MKNTERMISLMGNRRMFTSGLCLLLILAAFTGCGKSEEKKTQVPEEKPAMETVMQTGAAMETEAVAETEEGVRIPNAIAVSTPYGKIYYQEQWAEFMKVEQLSEDDILRVRFVAEINGADYPLFALNIGTAEEDAIAQLTDADGVQRNVQVIMEENGDYQGLSAEEQNRLCAMQEEINFVIENLK